MPVNPRALQLNLEGLFKLLGGSADDREKFWEKIKGITTPREAVLVNNQLNSLATTVKQLAADTKALKSVAGKV